MIAATRALQLAPNLNLRSGATVSNTIPPISGSLPISMPASAAQHVRYLHLSSFLPEDENFVTMTAMRGFAYKFGGGEVGKSVALSAHRLSRAGHPRPRSSHHVLETKRNLMISLALSTDDENRSQIQRAS